MVHVSQARLIATVVVVRSHRTNLLGWDYFAPYSAAKPDNGLGAVTMAALLATRDG
jgi:hypothetical protein